MSERSPLLTASSPTAARNQLFYRLACLYGATAVVLGAFGAHGLKKRISDPARIANWGTAAHYQVRTEYLLALVEVRMSVLGIKKYIAPAQLM